MSAFVAVSLVRAAASAQAVSKIRPAGPAQEEAPASRALHYQK